MYQDRESSLCQTKAQRKAARLIVTAGSPRMVVAGLRGADEFTSAAESD